MKIAICDDDPNDLVKISNYVKEYVDDSLLDWKIDSFLDYKKFLIDTHKYDAVILDVLLGNNVSGIDIAKQIRFENNDLKIIFCSTSPEYSLDAFSVKCFRYLVKPIIKKKLFEYLDDLSKLLCVFELEFKDIDRHNRKINILKIMYIEMERRISKIVFHNGVIRAYKTMSDWFEMLRDYHFCICCKGVIVNLRQVERIKDDKVFMKNKDVVYLSRMCRKQFTSSFYEYLDSLL